MKKILFYTLFISLILYSCVSADNVVSEDIVSPPSEESETELAIEIQIPDPEPVSQEPEIPVPEPVLIVPVEEEPEVVTSEEPEIISVDEDEYIDQEVIFEEPELHEEYLRSISNLSGEEVIVVPPAKFEEDKGQIFIIIEDLDRIMKKKDFDSWYAYLTDESAEYWSNRHNLLELSRYLFSVDDFRFNNIREYFEMFFIPARRGRIVDEIRYVTPEYVKVVQYKNKTDVIYYFFEKQNGEWKLKLDTL